MKLGEYLTMIKAGFTKKEIQDIVEKENQPEETEQESSPAPVHEPDPVENPGENVDNTEAVLSAIRELRDAIQGMNIRNDQMPEASDRTGEDVIRSMIGGK